ncbi:MAG: helix-turn-helix domain-containing protein [Candidatus Zophobacter franzmannii]|nr:helix-turn-helix domain-containing protein [Candidatus Zophobacter franzmannii]
MDDIAFEAKVGKGTLYRYFKNKEDLYIEVAIHGFMTIKKQLEDIAGREIEFVAKLRLITAKFEKFVIGRKVSVRVMEEAQAKSKSFCKGFKENLDEHKRVVRHTIASVMQQGLDSELLMLDVTATQYAELWIHHIVGLSRFASDIDKIPMETLIQLHLRESNEES